MVEDNLSSGHQAELLRLSLLKTGENTAVFALETYQNVVKASSLFSVISYFPSPRFLCFLTFFTIIFSFYPQVHRCVSPGGTRPIFRHR